MEEKVFIAAALAHNQTGRPIFHAYFVQHHGAGTTGSVTTSRS
ncbi:hypothetical protein ACLBR5_05280 [Escherichia coli]